MSSPPSLPDSQTLYRTIARNLPDGGVWLFDRNLRCLVAEGVLADLWGRVSGVLEGRPAEQLFDAEVLARLVPRFDRALRGANASYETDYRGRHYWSHYTALQDRAG